MHHVELFKDTSLKLLKYDNVKGFLNGIPTQCVDLDLIPTGQFIYSTIGYSQGS